MNFICYSKKNEGTQKTEEDNVPIVGDAWGQLVGTVHGNGYLHVVIFL